MALLGLLDLVREYTATTGTGTVTLAGAVGSFRTFASAGAVNGSSYYYAIVDTGVTPNARETGYGVYSSSAHTLTRNLLNSTTGALLNLSGSAEIFITPVASLFSSVTPTYPAQGRLTLTASTPVMTADVSGATTIRYTPYTGSYVPVYDGVNFVMTNVSSELTQSTTDTTKSPAAVAANKNYDMFVWNDAGTVRCTRGPMWSTDTTRGTGAGSTELIRLGGTLVNAYAITNGPAANRGTYVGTVRSNAASTIDFIQGGAAPGGVEAKINLWNMYNRIKCSAYSADSGGNYTYTTATWRAARASNNNRISFIIGVQEDAVTVDYGTFIYNISSGYAQIGLGFDTTSAVSSYNSGALSLSGNGTSEYAKFSASCLGAHYVQAVELGGAGAYFSPSIGPSALVADIRL